jgi:hypothetical protein
MKGMIKGMDIYYVLLIDLVVKFRNIHYKPKVLWIQCHQLNDFLAVLDYTNLIKIHWLYL